MPVAGRSKRIVVSDKQFELFGGPACCQEAAREAGSRELRDEQARPSFRSSSFNLAVFEQKIRTLERKLSRKFGRDVVLEGVRNMRLELDAQEDQELRRLLPVATFLRDIPGRYRVLVRGLCDSHMEALEFLKVLGDSGSVFLEQEGTLAYYVLNLRLFKPDIPCIPWQLIKEMITMWCPRLKLAGFVGLPATQGTIHVLKKFRLEALTRGTALQLARMLKDEDLRQRLARLEVIDRMILGVLSNAGDHVSDGFLKNLGDCHRCQKTSDGRSVLAILSEAKMRSQNLGVRLPVFDTVEQVEKKLRQLVLKEFLKSPAMQKPFPPPPRPGILGIVHLSNNAELTEHSLAQGVCLDTSNLYLNAIEAGHYFAYRFEPPVSKRAGTVLVELRSGKPRFHSAKYSHNGEFGESKEDREVAMRLKAWVEGCGKNSGRSEGKGLALKGEESSTMAGLGPGKVPDGVERPAPIRRYRGCGSSP